MISQIFAEKVPEECLVCATLTSILNLQINVCFACAAFYRRSVKTKRTYKCLKNNGNCDVTIKTPQRTSCRYCRYQKCIKVGLRSGKTRRKRTTKNNKIEQNFVNLSFGNFDNVFEHVLKMFKQTATTTSITTCQSYTEDFNNLMLKFLETTKPSEPLTAMKDSNVKINFFKEFYINAAQMLCNYQPFSNLCFEEKVIIYNNFWFVFSLLERAYRTRQYCGGDDSRYLQDKHQYVNFSKLSESQYFANKLIQDDCNSFMIPLFLKGESNMKRFKKYNPTFFEFAYMCQTILWSTFEMSELEESTHKMAENIILKIADDLHNYYIDVMRVEPYAIRQSRLHRIIVFTKSFEQEHKQKVIAAKMFNDFAKHKIPCCPFMLNFFEFFLYKIVFFLGFNEKRRNNKYVFVK